MGRAAPLQLLGYDQMNQSSAVSAKHHGAVPFWRDVRVLAVLSQIVFAIIVAVVAGLLYANLTRNMAERGMSAGFGFLNLEAGFEIKEGIKYSPADSYGRAFLVGVVNTLRVSFIGVILATILGIVAGVARLSDNWLVSKTALVYIEIIRNTPLLVQLFFWYMGVAFQLPPVRESITLPGSIFINQRGVFMPWAFPSATFRFWLPFLIGGIVIAVVLWIVLTRYQMRTGQPSYRLLAAVLALLLIPTLGWFVAGKSPLVGEVPVLERFNFKGGLRLSPEFTAIVVGLVVYTAAFIAEVVRGGILAVRRGQIEAARALGLTHMQTLQLVVFPQAMRVIIPPLISQYLNLTKNSSLAIACGFPDLYMVAGTILNQTGRPVPVLMMVMGSYLVMSLVTSLLMNIYNRAVQFVER
jgi:general L-amino acid transport system permease protein